MHPTSVENYSMVSILAREIALRQVL